MTYWFVLFSANYQIGKEKHIERANTVVSKNANYFEIHEATEALVVSFKKELDPKAKKIKILIENFFEVPKETHDEFIK